MIPRDIRARDGDGNSEPGEIVWVVKEKTTPLTRFTPKAWSNRPPLEPYDAAEQHAIGDANAVTCRTSRR